MPDVFLSYAREDRERASVLARALESHGWSVWWDPENASEGHDIDNPSTLGLGTIQKISLEPNQEYYVRLSESAESLKVVLDMKRADGRNSNLLSRLSVLNRDGTVAEDSLINFNEIDTGARKTASWSTRQAAAIGFKLLNGNSPADFWLSVRQEPASQFVPFFGAIVPLPMKLAVDASGLLGLDEDASYMTSLRQGDYQIVVDFANAERRKTNILGSVALLDGDGGNYRELVRFNEVDVSYRKIGTFLVRNDGPVILNVQNNHDTVRYALRLAQAGSERRDVEPTFR